MTLFYYSSQQFNTETSTKTRLSRIDVFAYNDLSLAFNEQEWKSFYGEKTNSSVMHKNARVSLIRFRAQNFYATNENCNDIFISIFRASTDTRRQFFVKLY